MLSVSVPEPHLPTEVVEEGVELLGVVQGPKDGRHVEVFRPPIVHAHNEVNLHQTELRSGDEMCEGRSHAVHSHAQT